MRKRALIHCYNLIRGAAYLEGGREWEANRAWPTSACFGGTNRHLELCITAWVLPLAVVVNNVKWGDVVPLR